MQGRLSSASSAPSPRLVRGGGCLHCHRGQLSSGQTGSDGVGQTERGTRGSYPGSAGQGVSPSAGCARGAARQGGEEGGVSYRGQCGCADEV